MTPIEIRMKTYSTDNFQIDLNDEQFRNNLDLLEEHCDRLQMTVAAYQQKVARYYNSRVLTKNSRKAARFWRENYYKGVPYTQIEKGPTELVR